VNDRLENVVRKTFQLAQKEISEEWSSDNIPGWDSMGHLSLLLAVEKEFNIKFEIDEMFQITTLKDIDCLIQKKEKKRVVK
jgi:acyl carrier protein